MVWKLVLVATGGAVGSIMRYLVAGWTQRLIGGAFPLGTLCVNVAGSFLIGLLLGLLAGPLLIAREEEFRLLLIVGFLGGFTTFSTFAFETFALLNSGQLAWAGLNVVATNMLGLFAVLVGYRLGQAWVGV